MIAMPSHSRSAMVKPWRVGELKRMLAEVDQELALTQGDAESCFLCPELVEFRQYLADELEGLSLVSRA